jgi:hypothetical protein
VGGEVTLNTDEVFRTKFDRYLYPTDMRIIDFIIFYLMAYYKKYQPGTLYWDNYLKRSVYGAGLIAMFWLFLIVEVLFFLLGRVDFTDFKFWELIAIVLALLSIQLFRYIYVVKKRYELIVKHESMKFSLGLNMGLLIVFLMFLFSLLAFVASTIMIHFYLKS